jgi:hypothetical protein
MTSFNYVSNVKKPGDTTKMKNIFSVIFNVRDSLDYAKSSLINGYDCKGKSLILGDSRFVKSGYCDTKKSVPRCRGKDRYIYIDNVPQNVFPCVDKNQPIHSNCLTNENSGIIPGLLQDVMQSNPFELIYSMMGDGSVINEKCVLRTEKVGNTTDGFHRETYCSPERQALNCTLKNTVTEYFTSPSPSPSPSPSKMIWVIIALFSVMIFFLFFMPNIHNFNS